MSLNTAAQAEKAKLSPKVQNRVDELLKRSAVHDSDISKILTTTEWKDLAQNVIGKPCIFEIDSFDELNTLFDTPEFWKLCDPSGFIKSLFRTNYSDILKREGKIGKPRLNKELQKQYEPKSKRIKTKTSSIIPHSAPDRKNNEMQNIHAEHIARLLPTAYNIILHGAPGTGKTYLAKQIAEVLGCSGEQIKMVQFHPSYDYTDFMEGLRPVKDKSSSTIGFERKNGAFKEFCKNAIQVKMSITEEDKTYTGFPPFVFIIDEINRGEISKILGECMFSIDPGYVGEDGRIESQYQNLIDDITDPFKDGFYRPDNVYIIGTMNDIDRGVESMDLAMRRRFQFIEIKAEDTQSEILKDLKDSDLIKEAIARMNTLNEVIRNTPELGEDYCIGASYFLKIKNFTDDKWKNLWDYHLKGLLKEYVRGLEDNSLMEQFRKAYNSIGVALPNAEKEDREEN